MRDPYALLGIEPGAAPAAIKAAFRALAKAHHPDRAPADPSAHSRFAELTRAYARACADAETRAAHAARLRPAPARPGSDRRIDLVLTLAEAYAGGPRRIELTPDLAAVVRLPAGLEPGAKLRLRGMGEPGAAGGPDGDAIVEITLAPHARFRVVEADVHGLLVVSPRLLALGGEVATRGVLGEITARVPPRATPGQVLTLPGQGLPARGRRPAGDLRLTLKVGASLAAPAPSFDAAARAFSRRWTARPAA